MIDPNLETLLKKPMVRRDFLLTGLAAMIAMVCVTPVSAQRRRPLARRPLVRRRLRILRRRANRRIKRRGNQLEERARRALRQGQVRPLRDVMKKIRQRTDAEVLEVDLHKRPKDIGGTGEWIYALRLLTLNGRVRDVFMDAKTLEVLHIDKQRNRKEGVPLPPLLLKRSPLPPLPTRPKGRL